MLFRLALIPLVFYLAGMLLIPRRMSMVLAVCASSLVFAGALFGPAGRFLESARSPTHSAASQPTPTCGTVSPSGCWRA